MRRQNVGERIDEAKVNESDTHEARCSCVLLKPPSYTKHAQPYSELESNPTHTEAVPCASLLQALPGEGGIGRVGERVDEKIIGVETRVGSEVESEAHDLLLCLKAG